MRNKLQDARHLEKSSDMLNVGWYFFICGDPAFLFSSLCPISLQGQAVEFDVALDDRGRAVALHSHRSVGTTCVTPTEENVRLYSCLLGCSTQTLGSVLDQHHKQRK